MKAGLSVSCVSKYLNHPQNVLPSTRDKIEDAIRELNYSPSVFARSLRTKRTFIIAAVMESILNPFMAGIFEGIRAGFEKRGYITVLQTFPLRRISRSDFSFADGIVICFPDYDKNIKSIQNAAGDKPVVIIHGHDAGDGLPSVLLNVGEGSRLAAEYLYNSGCRSFISVGGPAESSMSKEKTRAVRDYISSAPEKTSLSVFVGENSYRGGINMVDRASPLIKNADAILCESDALATGVISRLGELNCAVPDDIRVIGYDNIPLAGMFKPALTTVAIPSEDICAAACSMMCAAAEGKQYENIVFSPKLIVRETA